MRIAIGCDHRGLELKQSVISLLIAAGHTYQDFGCHTTDSVDYPDYARAVAGAVARGDFDRGILVCGTGIGMSMAANKVKGIRAGLCHDALSAQRSRQHNDANILCLGEDTEYLPEIVTAFLTTEFEGDRHQRRVDKIMDIEN